MQKLTHFFQYHNAIPIALGIVLLGGASAFAAANPEAIYSVQETVVAIDNTYIASKDLAGYTPRAQVTGVTEDDASYYVAYTLATIDVQDGVWQDVAKAATLQVTKETLGQRDLKDYVAEQLAQNIAHEIDRLHEAQAMERTHISTKVVSTAYSGLVGALFDATTQAQTPHIATQYAAALSAGAAPQLTGSGPVQLLVGGKNPATLTIRDRYTDLGAVIAGPLDALNLGIKASVDGGEPIELSDIVIDTSVAGEHTIEYIVIDAVGRKSSATRTVNVIDPAAAATDTATTTSPTVIITDMASTSSSTAASTIP